MPPSGWKRLIAEWPGFRGVGAFPIAAYSEFMPPPRMGITPYGATAPGPFAEDDPWGWRVDEHEEAFELRPGLARVAGSVVGALVRLGRGETSHGIARAKLEDNPYWPSRLAGRVGTLAHERYTVLMPMALSRTQDDKGRLRWTLFGSSEQGPARGFWRGFFSAPGHERPAEQAFDFLRNLIATAHGVPIDDLADLRRAGFRILPRGDLAPPLPSWPEGPLPSWTGPLLWDGGRLPRGLRYLLTFRPFAALPDSIQRAYLAGDLHLIPFPGSLLFWGASHYLRLARELPMAMQVPLLNIVPGHEAGHGLRVPQSGWLREPRPDGSDAPGDHREPIRDTFHRTHRNERVERDAIGESEVSSREDRMAHVLFDDSEAIGLYGKPMARNAQLWTRDDRLLLDGPRAGRDEIDRAARSLREGGTFGYRFQYPAMRVGEHEVYWHRPLVACLPPGADRPVVIPGAPTGYLTAYRADRPDPEAPVVESWPRLLDRAPYRAAITLFARPHDPRPHHLSRDCRALLDARDLLGEPLPRSFARSLVHHARRQSLDGWLDALPAQTDDPEAGAQLADELRRTLEPDPSRDALPGSPTFERTARRTFEVAYWRTIAGLSSGRFPNRNNADCARDPATRSALRKGRRHVRRDLERLGDHLLAQHAKSIADAGLTGRAWVGDLPFHWRTDFDFAWSDGWHLSQGTDPAERDLIVVIPGLDRGRAVIMADHYDTAFMEDVFGESSARDGPRLATLGADDNTSATAALLMAAPVLLDLARDGRLGCDVWLVHLTGEEFPADCLGARHLSQKLVEGHLAARMPDGRGHDLSSVRVEGVYVLDMVAHDNPRRRGVFQIAPGTSRESMRLALHAHHANEAWNAHRAIGNRHPARRGGTRLRRQSTLPLTAPFPEMRGEVRPHDDPRSTLYNSDGQIFSDAGIPVVLFMEDYDINRSGYHDSKDTMAGIDLPYGAALAAIAIDSVARAAGATAMTD